MKRILFVDDQPEILAGLQNSLRRHRKKWKMVFAEGAEEAIEKLKGAEFDVIVSDIRMPGMDGIALLRLVQERYSNTVRIALSGHSELGATMKTIPVAHQFLAKPCDPEKLDKVIERACGLQNLIGEAEIQERVGKLEKLPPVPKIYSKLSNALNDPNVDAKDVAEILEQDVAMCAKILQLVNSAFFASAMRVTNIHFAVVRLGFQLVKDIVLAFELFGGKEGDIDVPNFDLTNIHHHALVTSQIARSMFKGDKRLSDDAFTAGILHDVGQLVLAATLPEKYEQAVSSALETGCPLHETERDIFGITHAEIGGYLLGLWGLPASVVESVTYSHNQDEQTGEELNLMSAVYLAASIASEAISEISKSQNLNATKVDEELVKRLGIEDTVSNCREKALSIAQDVQKLI